MEDGGDLWWGQPRKVLVSPDLEEKKSLRFEGMKAAESRRALQIDS